LENTAKHIVGASVNWVHGVMCIYL